MCWGPKDPVDVGLLGPCGPVESLGPCGPVGLLRCWGACAPLNCWGLAARWSVDAGTRVGAYRIRPPNIPQGMNVPPRYVRRYVHSAPFGGVRGAYAVAPRGFAAQGFALGYGPPGLQPGRVRPIRALRPGWEGVCNTPLPWYVHSGPFGYPASFHAPAGAVRRRPEASETLKQLVWAFPRPRIP